MTPISQSLFPSAIHCRVSISREVRFTEAGLYSSRWLTRECRLALVPTLPLRRPVIAEIGARILFRGFNGIDWKVVPATQVCKDDEAAFPGYENQNHYCAVLNQYNIVAEITINLHNRYFLPLRQFRHTRLWPPVCRLTPYRPKKACALKTKGLFCGSFHSANFGNGSCGDPNRSWCRLRADPGSS